MRPLSCGCNPRPERDVSTGTDLARITFALSEAQDQCDMWADVIILKGVLSFQPEDIRGMKLALPQREPMAVYANGMALFAEQLHWERPDLEFFSVGNEILRCSLRLALSISEGPNVRSRMLWNARYMAWI